MSDIKIFISCHRPFKVLNNKLFYPIQVGTALSKTRFGELHDDDDTYGISDNISHKNRYYCELTAQYWAWKHCDADYYGFFHYRRYLSFNKGKKSKVMFERNVENIDESLKQTENLNEEAMQKYINQYDLVVPKRSFSVNNKLQYSIATNQRFSDLKTCIDIIDEFYPHMSKVAHKFLRQSTFYYCNMYIMKKELFHNYCAWLFDVLQKHEERTDLSEYNTQEFRVSGFLAERLCAIYINYLKSQKKYKIGELELIKFNNCDLDQKIQISDNEIPVVIDCSNVDKTAITMLSAMKQNINNNIKFIILHDKLDEEQKNQLKSVNAKIIFVKKQKNVLKSLNNLKQISNMSKLVYCTDKIVFRKDIESTFNNYKNDDFDVVGSLDIDYISNWFGFDKKQKKFERKKFGVDYKLFINTNLCILNLSNLNIQKEDKKLNNIQLLNKAFNNRIISDFDIVNKYNCAYKRKKISLNFTPYEYNQKFLKFDPVAVDYSLISNRYYDDGMVFDQSDLYWSVARCLPFYERVLKNAMFKKPTCKQRRKLKKDKFKAKLFKPGSTAEMLANTYTRWLYR